MIVPLTSVCVVNGVVVVQVAGVQASQKVISAEPESRPRVHFFPPVIEADARPAPGLVIVCAPVHEMILLMTGSHGDVPLFQ